MKKIVIALFTLLASISVEASVVRTLDLGFQSGASFSGDVTFADDFSSVLAVDGVLTGYQPSASGYVGSGSTVLNWLWAGGSDFAGEEFIYSTFFMDNGWIYGGYSHWLTFTYDFSDIANLTFSAAAYGNQIDYSDSLVSGTLSAASVPEPGSLMLLALGLFCVVLPRLKKSA